MTTGINKINASGCMPQEDNTGVQRGLRSIPGFTQPVTRKRYRDRNRRAEMGTQEISAPNR